MILNDVYSIIDQIKTILKKEKNLLEIPKIENKELETIIIGDIHGKITDLLLILKKFGDPSENLRYLFLGDYVDRGSNSLEVIIKLYELKIKYPNYVYLLRGNHEVINISKNYGFLDECNTLFKEDGTKIFNLISSTFTYLPIACNLFNEYFCVHGGISPKLKKITDLNEINRFDFDSLDGIVNKTPENHIDIIQDLLLSYPDTSHSKEFKDNSRGIGHTFGSNVLIKFLDENNLKSLIRAHEVCFDGYFKGKNYLTLFSSTKYCGIDNYGAVGIFNSIGHTYIFVFEENQKLSNQKENCFLEKYFS